jgi:hypothetical protein
MAADGDTRQTTVAAQWIEEMKLRIWRGLEDQGLVGKKGRKRDGDGLEGEDKRVRRKIGE